MCDQGQVHIDKFVVRVSVLEAVFIIACRKNVAIRPSFAIHYVRRRG